MKRFLLTTALLGALFAPAAAQTPAGGINTVPAPGVSLAYISRATYSAVWIGLAPAATTTDLVCISASSTKTVRLQSMKFSGSSATTLSLPVTILRRASLDTGGTAASTTANPANTIGKRDNGNATATAVLISYTANPTINDTSPTYLDSAQLAISLTTMATVSIPVTFDWAKDIENFVQPPVLTAGSTQQICANFNSTSLASGLITGSITWTEE
jgi:hypothetical protein